MRVALADDAALFREGVARLLTDAGFEVVAKTGDAAELLARVRAAPPDVVVVDIRMPPGFSTEGLDAAQEIRRNHPDVGVLVLSAHVEPHYALQLLDQEARGAGYLLKDRVTDPAELADAVRRVAAGGLVIDPAWWRRWWDGGGSTTRWSRCRNANARCSP
ncbi:response regulator receiver domain-containing protein [Lentzea atacamensis]|uniref:Response regulator receiver domain-containing protein n=1 Tax=Lentzea atacamensis TaxID=531938 RepID=A0ABX9EID4_9PSEU|nr:response regulator receiver domain-containing protein [Lentzea atacamensis]